jgi:hypothetical protein
MSERREDQGFGRSLLWLVCVAAWNPWSVAWFISPDGFITSSTKRGIIWAAELLAIVVILLMARRGALPRVRLFSVVLWCGLLLGSYGTARSFAWIETGQERQDKLEMGRVAANEGLHLSLVPRFKVLGRSLEELDVPGLGVEGLFGEDVLIRDVLTQGPRTKIEHVLELEESEWSLTPAVVVARPELNLYRPLLDNVAWVEHAKAYLVKTSRSLEEPHRLAESEAGFGLLFHDKVGRVQQISAHAHVEWRNEAGEGDTWKISALELTDLKVISAKGIAYEEVLGEAIHEEDLLAELRESGSINEVVKQLSTDDWTRP